MYNNQYRPISPYAQRLTALEQQMMYQQPTVPVPQTIQPVNTAIQTQIYCYSVNSADELSSLNLMPNTTFLRMTALYLLTSLIWCSSIMP